MEKLSVEEWEGLSEDERAARPDEQPEPVEPGTADEAGSEADGVKLAALAQQVSDLSGQLRQLSFEKDGTTRDLREERRVRQELEGKLVQLQEASDTLVIKDLKDDDYVNAAQVKKILGGMVKLIKTEKQRELDTRSDERMADDEDRMRERTDRDPQAVKYDEAIDEFKALAAKDASLWDDVNREARRPGGHPAQKAYNIALRESPKYKGLERQRGREDVIKQIDDSGRVPSLRGGGGAGRPKDLSKLTESDIANLSDVELDKLLTQV